MEMDCIPAGMELFPAADEEQFEFIKRVIDDCDYYIVIVGGRYGSVTSDGVSYTEKEYDYAHEKGLKIIAFLHKEPDQLPVTKSETKEEARARLAAFREKLASGRLVKYWERPEELPGLVALSLQKTIKTFPAVGWVRANAVASEQILAELNELRKENANIKRQVAPAQIEGLAGLDEEFLIHLVEVQGRGGLEREGWQMALRWSDIFYYIAPSLLTEPRAAIVCEKLSSILHKQAKKSSYYYSKIEDDDFHTLMLQFKALGLAEMESRRGSLFWSLTPKGQRLLMEMRAVRSKDVADTAKAG
jgi:Domain of unknown function (DUF4062)